MSQDVPIFLQSEFLYCCVCVVFVLGYTRLYGRVAFVLDVLVYIGNLLRRFGWYLSTAWSIISTKIS